MTVALDDLRRARGRLEPERLTRDPLDLGRCRRVRPDRARQLADAHPLERSLESIAIAVELKRPTGKLQTEGGRLGVHAVRPTDRHRARGTRTHVRRRPRTLRRARLSTSRPASCTASASAVSSTSEDVSPKWIQRPSGPTCSASASTNAATSWFVTRSSSATRSRPRSVHARSDRRDDRSAKRHRSRSTRREPRALPRASARASPPPTRCGSSPVGSSAAITDAILEGAPRPRRRYLDTVRSPACALSQ